MRNESGLNNSSSLKLADQLDLETFAWAFDPDDEFDFKFYETILRQNPGLALDAGCGAGRLLIDLLRAGFQVEACDISEEMLSLCRLNLEAAGFDTPLYHKAIQDLPFSSRYKVIFLACATLMCITDSLEVDRCLSTLNKNLLPGGSLALSILTPSYLHVMNGPFPTPWEPYYEMSLPEDSGELVVDWRALDIDSTTQIVKEECRYRWFRGGTIIREEISPGIHRWYHPDQLVARLQKAGFGNVQVYSNYSFEPKPHEHVRTLSFVAKRV
jgi:SAM-dependent methyltransferase